MDITENLVLHLKFDQARRENNALTVEDHAGGDHHCVLSEHAVIAADTFFGSCLSLAGDDYGSCGDCANPGSLPFSVSLWFKVDHTDNTMFLFSKKELFEAAVVDGHYRYSLQPHWNWDGGESFPVTPGEWYHVALTYDGAKQVLYQNGKKVFERDQDGDMGANHHPLHVGAWGDSPPGAFLSGKISGLRIYHEALTATKIEAIMPADQGVYAAFLRAHPLSFELSNDQEAGVIYIEEDPVRGDPLFLTIRNRSQRTLALNGLGTGAASPAQHHFALTFRPGTLSATAVDRLTVKESDDWSVTSEWGEDGGVSVYILRKSTAAVLVEPGGKFQLTFQRVSAAAGGGARGTRVEMGFTNLKYQGTSDSEMMHYSRGQHLSVANRIGKKRIPLHASFYYGNTVLNVNRQDNHLTLRVTNTSHVDPLSLRPITPNSPPTILLHFDTGSADGEPWALGSETEVQGINVAVRYPGQAWQDVHRVSGEDLWRLAVPAEVTSLAAGHCIEIWLGNIVTAHPSGHTHCHLHYQNIPGYWDGQFTCLIQKRPFLIVDHRDGNNRVLDSKVGFATNDPKEMLHLRDGHFRIDDGEFRSAGSLVFHPDVDKHGAGMVRFLNGAGKETARIDEHGRLGVGKTPDQNYILDVNGNMKASSVFASYFWDKDNSSFYLNPADFSKVNRILATSQSGHSIRANNQQGTALHCENTSKHHPTISTKAKGSTNALYCTNNSLKKPTIIAKNKGASNCLNCENHSTEAPTIWAENKGTSTAILGQNNSEDYPAIWAKNKNAKGYAFYTENAKAYGQASSIRHKKDVRVIDDALEKINNIEGVHFTWKASGEPDLGFVAEEVAKHIPEAVTMGSDGFAEGMSYNHVLPVLVEAVKTQQKTIEDLMARIKKLEAERIN